MQHIRRTIMVIIVANIIILGATFIVGLAEDHASQPSPKAQHEVDANSGMNSNLLPPGCGNVTPGSERLPTSCLSGSVWLGGVPIEGAEVTIIAPNGDRETVRTQPQTGSLVRPQYGLALSGPPLNIARGQSIQIMAVYADRSVTIDYAVRDGTQRVDLALPSPSASGDYIYTNQLWYSAKPGRLRGPHSIALDSEGNLYVVDRENQRIQVFDPAGNAIRQWGDLGNGQEQFFSPFGIAIDNTDNIYVTDTGNHRVLKFNKLGTQIDEIGSFGSELGQLYSPEGVVVDNRGSIYVADSANHRIQKFEPDGKIDEDFGIGGAVGTLGGGGSADDVKFRYPTAMAVDSQDNLYVTDYQNDRVQKFDRNGAFLLEFGTFGHCSSAEGCKDGDMRLPDGIAIDKDDMIYVSDTNHRVQKFDSAGNWIELFGERGTGNGQFEYPKGLAVHTNGQIYIADEFNHRIQIVGSTFAWLGTWGISGNNEKQLSSPQGTAVDSDGSLYVADSDENRVQKFDKTGGWIRNISGFDSPQDVVTDSQGNIYVADTGNNRIQKLDKNGNLLAAIGSVTGNEDGQFKQPIALALDDENNIYVVDRFNHRIQKFNAAGVHLDTWGGTISSGAVGKFNAPTDIAIGITGNVYVADGSNHRIQKFDRTGQHLATIGEFGARDSQFDTVTGVDLDNEGNIYAVDETGRIQKFNSDGNHLATWGSAPIRGQAGGGGSEGEVAPRFNQLDKELRITVVGNDTVYVSDTRNNRIQTYMQGGSGNPIAFINWVGSSTIEQGDSLEIRGIGQDSDASNNIALFEWTSSKGDNLSGRELHAANTIQSRVNNLIVPYDQLSSGTQTILLRVQDNEGQWSEIDTTSIYVSPPIEDVSVVWTFLLYLAADYADNELLLDTFNEKIEQLQKNFNNPNVRVAIQLDGPGENDTRRIKLTPGNPAGFEEIPMNELEMDTDQALADFIRWGQGAFPAKNYYLTISDHGQAIQGIAWDKTSDTKNGTAALSSRLTVKEIGVALSAEDVAPVAILHLDACSMNLVETAYEVRNATDFLISSQWMGWDYFAYDSYITKLNTSDEPGTVAEKIVQEYATLAKADDHPFTISVLDMQRSDVALNAIDDLASELAAYVEAHPDKIQTLQDIRDKVQTFESDSNYQNTPLDMYIDLVSWAQELQITSSLSPAVRDRAGDVTEELIGQMVKVSHAQSQNLPDHIKEGAFIDNSGAKGLSIFYPVNQYSIVFQDYAEDLLFSFTGASVTDNWLRFLQAATDPLPSGQQPEVPPPPLPPIGGPVPNVTFTPSSQSDMSTETPTPTVIPPATSTATPLPTATPTFTSPPPSSTTPENTATPTVTVSITRTPSPDEPNDTCEQAHGISDDGLTYDYTFGSENDEDWFRLDVTAGVEYRIDIDVPDDSPADVEPELHPNCDSLPQQEEEWGQSFSPGARLFHSSNEDGSIFLRLKKPADGPFGDHVKYQMTVRSPSVSSDSRAAILIAGQLKRNDPLQSNIHNVTDQALALFQKQGYTSEDIYYLADDINIEGDIPNPDASTQNVRLAITDWAMNKLESDGVLNLYIIDHGREDQIYLNGIKNDVLEPDELDRWLTELEEAKPNLKVNVFIEACNAGSFIEGTKSISKEGRVIVTSSDVEWLAYASEYGAYFSDHLLTSLWQGRNLFSSFLDASKTVQRLYPKQKPWLDANGNGIPNETEDFAIASGRGLPYAGTFSDGEWPPFIVDAAGPTTIDNGQGILKATVRDDFRIEDVWAVIYPPSYAPLDTRQDELVQETLQTLKLNAINDEEYAVDYRAFNEQGTYRIVLHAKDTQGMVARPVTLEVEVEMGSSTVYLPVVTR